MMAKNDYHPEPYWSEVAKRIDSREDRNVIAGDDEPYYHYKRARFLEMLSSVDFSGKNVMELGSGPGGNLKELTKKNAKSLTGVDISADMIALATKNLAGKGVTLTKTDGKTIPYGDKHFDLAITATVLQHNTDEAMLFNVIKELCRVTADKVVIFERIDDPIAGDELCLGRPVKYYEDIFAKHGFKLKETEFINIHTSWMLSGAVRRYLNPSTRQEGEPLNGVSLGIQKILLPITKVLDKVITSNRDLAKLEFERI
jgi:ubiquinone/menaquinone biosynthesis C-methylase UbiE